MIDKTCSFTGHRQIFHIHAESLPSILEQIILKVFNSGYIWFQSGGALGFDLLAADTVISLRRSIPDIKLRMILPCRNQAERWRASDRAHYNNVISLADDVIFMQESYTPYCMHERNRALADTSSLLISYLTNNHGGTAYTVRYAESKSKKIINIADLL